MSSRPLLVLSLEAFAPAALSCYGSSWNETPALDALAAQACLYDRWIVRKDDPLEPLKGLFTLPGKWLSDFSEIGTTELITDVGEIARIASDATTSTIPMFDRVVEVPLPGDASVQTEVDQTHLAMLVAEVLERDQSQEEDWGLIWIHTSALSKIWDAPRDLFPVDEIELADDGLDFGAFFPPLIDDGRVPHVLPDTPLAKHDWWKTIGDAESDPRRHPDFINAWMRTYGCQIRLFDFLVEVLLDALGHRDPRLMIMGTSGFQLGQAGVIGHQIGRLRSPQIQVPMMISDLSPVRMQSVTSDESLVDVLDSLARNDLTMFGPEAWSEKQPKQSRVETESARVRQATTTPSWFFAEDDDGSDHLYLKPDDLNDCNDVASLRPDVIEELRNERI